MVQRRARLFFAGIMAAAIAAGCSGGADGPPPVGPGGPQPTVPPAIAGWEMVPRVLVRASTDPVRIRVFVTGNAAEVSFGIRGFSSRSLALSRTSESLTLASKTAFVWEATTTAPELLSGFEAVGGANFLGRVGARGTDGTNAESHAVTGVVHGDWPETVGARLISPSVQVTDRLVNVQVGLSGDAIAQTVPSQLPSIADAITAVGADPDFLLIVPPAFSVGIGSAGYYHLRNDTKGIGAQIADRTETPPFTDLRPISRLQGLITVRDPAKTDLASPNTVHEVGHRFTAYLDAVYGSPGGAHWPISELAIGVMGYQRGAESERFGYRFERQSDGSHVMRSGTIESAFNSMELYMMGLLPPSAVDSFLVFANPAGLPAPGHGVRIASPSRYINADSVIKVVGPREPRVGEAPTQFTVVTVVLTRGRLLTPRELAFYDHAAARGEATEPVSPLDVALRVDIGVELPFAVATRGLGRLVTRVVAP